VNEKTHEWLGPTIGWVNGLILAGKNKDVEERNNIIQSVTGKGHSNVWPGTASIYIYIYIYIDRQAGRYLGG
jgi:hypothetical protein